MVADNSMKDVLKDLPQNLEADKARREAANILHGQVFDIKREDAGRIADALDRTIKDGDADKDGMLAPGEVQAAADKAKFRPRPGAVEDDKDQIAADVRRVINDLKDLDIDKLVKEKKIKFGPAVDPKGVDPLNIAKNIGQGLGGPTAVRLQDLCPIEIAIAADDLDKLDKSPEMQQQIKDLHNDGVFNKTAISQGDVNDLRYLPFAIEGLAKLDKEFDGIKGTKTHITDEAIRKYIAKYKPNEFTRACISEAVHHLQDNEPSGKYSRELIHNLQKKLQKLDTKLE